MSKKSDMKALSRGISRDMSPEAILKRLRIASSLHRTARMLGKARYVGKVGRESASQPVQSRPVSRSRVGQSGGQRRNDEGEMA